MAKFKTESGFEFECDPDTLDDVEVMELLVQVKKGDSLAMFEVYQKMLNAEDYARAKEFIRDKEGKAKASAFLPLLEECFEAIGNIGKNS